MGGVEREARRCGRRRTVRAAVAIDGCIDERAASRGEGFKSRGEPTRTRDWRVVIITATSQVLAKKRNEKPEVRAAARDAALREIKARAAKKKGAKK